MRTINDPQQLRLIDVFQGVIGDGGWKLIREGWQGAFRQVVLKELPVLRLGDDLDEFLGRPSAELHAMCGLLLIRDFHNWTVPESHLAVLFRSDVQYALNLEPGFEISQRTIERYLARLQEDEGLAAELMSLVTDRLVQVLDLQVGKQRLDSTHVLSDMASFGRTRMMGVAIKRFLVQVRRRQAADFEALPEEFRTRYSRTDGRLFGEAKTTEARQHSRQQAAENLHWIIEHFANHPVIQEWPVYRQLVTIFGQQCEVVEEQIVVRKQTGGDIILNPSDPDATYCGHKGQGYQVQLSETCDPDNEQQLILAALPQTAVEHDSQAVEPMLDDLQSRGHLPDTLTCDCSYGSDENVLEAAARGVTLISPVPGSAKFDAEALGPQHFEMNAATHEVTACPAGHAPIDSSYNAESDRVAVTMPLATCQSCALKSRCPVLEKKDSAKLYFKMVEYRSGQRRQHEQTVEFKTNYAPRAGIESTNSGLKRRLGLGQLRVRGSPAVAPALLLKITGWNILRASGTAKLRALVCKMMAREGHGALFSAISWLTKAAHAISRVLLKLLRHAKTPKPCKFTVARSASKTPSLVAA